MRDRRKRTVGFIESAMPADGIPRCPFTSNRRRRHVPSRRAALRRLHHPTPIQKTSYWPGHGTNHSVKITDPNVRVGSWPRENSEIEFANRNFVSTSINLKNRSAGDGCRDKTTEKTILRTFRARTFSRNLAQLAQFEVKSASRFVAAVVPETLAAQPFFAFLAF